MSKVIAIAALLVCVCTYPSLGLRAEEGQRPPSMSEIGRYLNKGKVGKDVTPPVDGQHVQPKPYERTPNNSDAPSSQQMQALKGLPHAVQSKPGRWAAAGAAAAAAIGSFVDDHPVWAAFFALLAIAMVGAAVSERLKKQADPDVGAQASVVQTTATAPMSTAGPAEPVRPASAAPAPTFTASLLGAFRSLAIKFTYFMALVVAVVGSMWLLMVLFR